MTLRVETWSIVRRAPLHRVRANMRYRGRAFPQPLFALCAMLVVVNAHAAVRAQFDRSPVREGDTVTLVIESDARSSDKPDLSPLRGDFDVLGTSTSTQLSFVNGHRSDLTRWLVQLQPRRAGAITIAPITVGNEQTTPLSLDVTTAAAQAPNDPARHVIVESETGATGRSIYVQQQIPYTVRLYYDDKVQAGDLAAPRADDAVIEKLGEDRRYTTTRDGHDYNVIERRYAVAAEKSGTLVIPPATFRGRAAAPPAPGSDADDMLQRFLRNSPFANDPAFRDRLVAGRLANSGQPISARGHEIALDVRPRPAGITGHWLPAEAVTLHDSWTEHPPQFKVGEPVKRTIMVDVKGLAASQIPALDIAAPDGAHVYPEATDDQSRTDGNSVYGIRQQTVTYIATAEGALTVPAITIDWWNTQSDSASRASLPQSSFKVLPGIAAPPLPPAPGNVSNAAPAAAATIPSVVDSSRSLLQRLGGPAGYAIAAALLATLGVAIWTLRRRRARRAQATLTSTRHQNASRTDTRSDLQKACAANDRHAALRALLAMAQMRWPDAPPLGLQSLAQRLGGPQDTLTDLERAIYGTHAAEWRGAALWTAFGSGFDKIPSLPATAPGDGMLPGVEMLYK